MEDSRIVDLYWERSEDAIAETTRKYGKYCRTIAWNILHSDEDSEECVNDTWMNAWKAMPDQRPDRLSAFLGRITRNLALKRWERQSAAKRGAGQVSVALEELQDCVPAPVDEGQIVDSVLLTELLDRFLDGLPKEKRIIFIRRYWYLSPVAEIAADLGIGESKVKMTLLRARNQLKETLEKEGFVL